MAAVTIVQACAAFPATMQERRELAVELAPQLAQEWAASGMDVPKPAYLLVHNPGEIGRTTAQATHRGDEAEALEEERGAVAVAVTLTDTIEGVEDLVVHRIEWSY